MSPRWLFAILACRLVLKVSTWGCYAYAPAKVLICIQQGADLYMARRIEQGLDRVDEGFTGVTLEIQRSLDYFESQLGKGYINRLLLLPMKRDGAAVLAALSAGLAVNLQALDLRELFVGQAAAELDEQQQAYCLAAVGAALRQEA